MPTGLWILFGILLLAIALSLAAGVMFDRSRRREGRTTDVRGTKQQYLGVPVAGEMVDRPPDLWVQPTEPAEPSSDETDEES